MLEFIVGDPPILIGWLVYVSPWTNRGWIKKIKKIKKKVLLVLIIKDLMWNKG